MDDDYEYEGEQSESPEGKVLKYILGLPRHRENRQLRYSFFQSGKTQFYLKCFTQGIFLKHEKLVLNNRGCTRFVVGCTYSPLAFVSIFRGAL